MFLVICSSANTVKSWWKQTSCVGQKAEKTVDPSRNTDEVCSLIPSAVARFSFFSKIMVNMYWLSNVACIEGH